MNARSCPARTLLLVILSCLATSSHVWVCKAPYVRHHIPLSCWDTQHRVRRGPYATRALFASPRLGIGRRNCNSCVFWYQKAECSKRAALAGKETAGGGEPCWRGSQLLTLTTDGPCHFLSCSPSGGEEFLQGNHARLCSENPSLKLLCC